ncbi:hypothetical protein TNCV_1155041 [Trichonephila clavipes]|nr:hypothetical protein TNCV_1155041 [Trichonephila clavipes]
MNTQDTDTSIGRGRLQSSRWRCCSASAKRRQASETGADRYGEKGRFKFVVIRGKENVRKVDEMIKANRRSTINGVAEELGIGHERAHKIINDILG